MKRAFVLGVALLAAAVYCGLVVTMGEHFGVNLSLGIPVGARTLIAFLGGLAAVILFFVSDDYADARNPKILLAAGIVLLMLGSYWGLFVAPPEEFMGQTQRIMYVHVPTAWFALLALTIAFVCAVVFLFRSDFKWDARMEGSIETGIVFGFLPARAGDAREPVEGALDGIASLTFAEAEGVLETDAAEAVAMEVEAGSR